MLLVFHANFCAPVFGDAHGEWLAFETEGWTMEDPSIISCAGCGTPVIWIIRQ
jgi:hypothetical protein